jgi:hypothetical protein
MNLCPDCGVEVESGCPACPLCCRPLAPGTAATTLPERPDRADPPLAPPLIRRTVLEGLVLLSGAAVLVLVAADVAPDRAVSWARYPLAGLAYCWLVVALAAACGPRLRWVLATEVVALDLFLLALDAFTPGSSWFVPLALPVTALAATVLGFTLLVLRRRRSSPAAALATVLLACGVFLLGLELLVNRYSGVGWTVGWSAVVFACLVPALGLLVFLRAWAGRRRAELRRLFHL